MQSVENTEQQILGQVTLPSGIMMLVDFGLMDLWTHDRPPLIPEGILSEEALKSANDGADFFIDGPHALEVGRRLGRQPHPLYIYDIPRHGVQELKEGFQRLLDEEGFEADLIELFERVPPRTRVNQILAHREGLGEVFFHGVQAVVVSNLPKNRPLPIVAKRMEEEEFAEHWKEVSLILDETAEVATSSLIGHVAVDRARLMFCDMNAAGAWCHNDSIDGMADFVFWGRDAVRLAQKFKAPHLERNVYGWQDKKIQEVAELGIQVQKHIDKHRMVVATDFRPHSDHWRLLEKIYHSELEAAVIDVNDSQVCGFMTSWGDGFFPVLAERDSNGRLVRIRIHLGNEATVRGMRLVNPR